VQFQLVRDNVAVTLLHNPFKALINNLPVRMSLNLTWLAALLVRGIMDENKQFIRLLKQAP
jgi:hypothetical protein